MKISRKLAHLSVKLVENCVRPNRLSAILYHFKDCLLWPPLSDQLFVRSIPPPMAATVWSAVRKMSIPPPKAKPPSNLRRRRPSFLVLFPLLYCMGSKWSVEFHRDAPYFIEKCTMIDRLLPDYISFPYPQSKGGFKSIFFFLIRAKSVKKKAKILFFHMGNRTKSTVFPIRNDEKVNTE